jgi:glycosyltransferase involved in cell wall biosynthesis
MSRILHLTESGGGVLEVIKNIAEIDEKNKHFLLVRRRDFSSNSINRSTDSLQIYFWEGNLFRSYLEYRKLSRKLKFDIVHFHSSRAGGLRFLFRGVHRAYSPHCFAFERQDISRYFKRIYELIERNLLHQTDGFHAVNELELSWAFKANQSMTLSLYEFVEGSKSRNAVEKCIIGLGRICVQKNPNRFIDIVNALRKESENIKVIWIGGGDENLTKSLLDNGITVTGWIDSESVDSYLESGSILLHTATWEGMPIVFYEAWSYGLPIFALSASYLEGISRVNIFNSDAEAVKKILAELREPSINLNFVIDRSSAENKLQKFYADILNVGNGVSNA